MTQLTERSCRICHGQLETFLHLGDLHPSNFLKPDEQPLDPLPYDLCACVDCRTVQLRHTINPDLMFRKYWYLSGINESMREELADVAESGLRMASVQNNDIIIDIGANDGTLLACCPKYVSKIAFEPALNLNDVLHHHANLVIADYFPRGLRGLDYLDGKVKLITSIACLYDLDEPGLFVEAIKRILHPEGIWIVQFQDWDQMQKATAFDNIVHEHLVYYSLASFERLIAPYGLSVIDAELRKINGGSYRLYVSHNQNRRVSLSPNVDALRMIEEGCEDWQTFNKFAWRCEEIRKQIRATIDAYIFRNRVIDVYGASTKFNTLAQWCGLKHPYIRQAWERSPDKFGLRTAGTNIPIVDEAAGRMDPPDALIVGIWQFRDSVLKREASYLAAGGTIIFPLPKVDIVSEALDVA
jgi:NDP-4-keto-2,6-dideoxyhexose 3-C-methyltransferase